MPHKDIDFSKLVNLCPAKKISLISTPDLYKNTYESNFPEVKQNKVQFTQLYKCFMFDDILKYN